MLRCRTLSQKLLQSLHLLVIALFMVNLLLYVHPVLEHLRLIMELILLHTHHLLNILPQTDLLSDIQLADILPIELGRQSLRDALNPQFFLLDLVHGSFLEFLVWAEVQFPSLLNEAI